MNQDRKRNDDRIVQSFLVHDDWRECRVCGWSLDVGDRINLVDTDDGPFCSVNCARDHLEAHE